MTPATKVFGVEWRIYRVTGWNESIQRGWVDLSCSAATVQACAGGREQWHRAEAHQRVSSELEWSGIPGRSCHEKALFHMAERIPEGTKRCRGTISVVIAQFPVGPIALWQTAMVMTYDLMLIKVSRDGTNWTIIQQRNHFSVSKMF